MDKLSLFDQMFYKLDEAGVGALVMQGATVLDPSGAESPPDADILAAHIGTRLREIPLLRKKLVRDPLGIGDLRPVEDPDFDLADHITRATLPSPGDEAAFVSYLERFSVERLDLKKPLWRFEIVDGLADGKLAVVTKLHHSLFDGVGALETLGSMYDSEPRPPETPVQIRRTHVEELSGIDLTALALGDSLTRLLAGPRFVRRNAGAIVGSVYEALLDRWRGDPSADEATTVSKTSLNVKLSADRRAVAYRVFDLSEFKSLTRSLGCKVNDLAMLLCSVALEHYFSGIGEELASDLVATMPINTRQEKHGTTGNALGVSMVNLHSSIPGLLERLRMIQKDAQAAKDRVRPEGGSAIDFDALQSLFSPLFADALAAAAGRLLASDLSLDQLLIANAVVTNVPGPREEMFVAGARVEYSIPMIPMADTMALSWGITSFGGRLTIGLHACGEAVRDTSLLIEGIDKAYAELAAHAGNA